MIQSLGTFIHSLVEMIHSLILASCIRSFVRIRHASVHYSTIHPLIFKSGMPCRIHSFAHYLYIFDSFTVS